MWSLLVKGQVMNFCMAITLKTWLYFRTYSPYIYFSGGIIIYGALWLFEDDFVHVVSITFTSLILTELLMVALTVRTWHYLMLLAEIFSLGIYIASLAVLTYFGKFERKVFYLSALLLNPNVFLQLFYFTVDLAQEIIGHFVRFQLHKWHIIIELVKIQWFFTSHLF